MEHQLNQTEREASLEKIQALEQLDPKVLDETFAAAHDAIFKEVDCLTCANCCKTTSPIIEQEDMDLLSLGLGISRAELIRDYLSMDEDGDFVFNSTPCPMLEADNRCKVYENRPEACRDYPHTRRKSMHKVMDLLSPNMEICPAVVQILNEITL